MEKPKTEFINFEQLRQIAISNNIPDNKVSIGIWGQNNGYFKKRIQINKITSINYFKLETK